MRLLAGLGRGYHGLSRRSSARVFRVSTETGKFHPHPPFFAAHPMTVRDHPTPNVEPPAFFGDLGRLRPGRHKVPAAEVARQQRERLLAGMLDAVGTEGYVATTVADVLERAGVSRRTFYEHFSDKEDCFLHAYDHVTERTGVAASEAYNAQPDWRSGMRAGLDLFLRTLAAHPHYARACLVEILAVGPEGLRRRDRGIQPFLRLFDGGRGEAPPGTWIPDTVAETILGGLLEAISARIRRGESEQLPELLDEFVYWCLVPFVGPAEAAREMSSSAVAVS
jgi:AcrR family transcriptional regulator